MRLSLAMFLPALALLAMTGSAMPDPLQSSDPPGKLGVWEGRWNYSGQIYETSYSHAHSDSGTIECRWMPNRGYMVCDYFSNDPPHDNLTALSYSPAAKSYTLVEIEKDAQAPRETITQSGNTWITSRAVPGNGKKLILRTVFVFLTPDKQTNTVQVSADKGQTWTKMIETTAVRVAHGD